MAYREEIEIFENLWLRLAVPNSKKIALPVYGAQYLDSLDMEIPKELTDRGQKMRFIFNQLKKKHKELFLFVLFEDCMKVWETRYKEIEEASKRVQANEQEMRRAIKQRKRSRLWWLGPFDILFMNISMIDQNIKDASNALSIPLQLQGYINNHIFATLDRKIIDRYCALLINANIALDDENFRLIYDSLIFIASLMSRLNERVERVDWEEVYNTAYRLHVQNGGIDDEESYFVRNLKNAMMVERFITYTETRVSAA